MSLLQVLPIIFRHGVSNLVALSSVSKAYREASRTWSSKYWLRRRIPYFSSKSPRKRRLYLVITNDCVQVARGKLVPVEPWRVQIYKDGELKGTISYASQLTIDLQPSRRAVPKRTRQNEAFAEKDPWTRVPLIFSRPEDQRAEVRNWMQRAYQLRLQTLANVTPGLLHAKYLLLDGPDLKSWLNASAFGGVLSCRDPTPAPRFARVALNVLGLDVQFLYSLCNMPRTDQYDGNIMPVGRAQILEPGLYFERLE
jgi:hypothetical protein